MIQYMIEPSISRYYVLLKQVLKVLIDPNCVFYEVRKNGILLPKLFWPTVRKNCSSDQEKNLKFEAEGWEFSKILRLLEQFIQTVKAQNSFW